MTIINKAAAECSDLFQRLAAGYYTHASMIHLAKDSRAKFLVPPVETGQVVPIGRVPKKAADPGIYDFRFYLDLAETDQYLGAQLDQVWLAGALLTAGDALSSNRYFDRAPELELIRHLRNGVAHGNRFRIDDFDKLSKYPAHNRDTHVRDPQSPFEITPAVQGTKVLFDFLGPGDVLVVLTGAQYYLYNLARGLPTRLDPMPW